MELFYGRNSGNSSRAMFGLEAAGVSYTPRLIDTTRGEQQDPAYKAVNPMGKIPSLTDGAFKLWESNAINWYVAEKNPSAHLLPDDLEGRASVQRWMLFQTAHVSPATLLIVRNTSQRMLSFWKFTPDPAAAEAGRKELARYLPVLEEALEGKTWFEERFSLADIALTPHFFLLAETGAKLPRNVAAWLDRATSHPAWKRAAARVFGS